MPIADCGFPSAGSVGSDGYRLSAIVNHDIDHRGHAKGLAEGKPTRRHECPHFVAGEKGRVVSDGAPFRPDVEDQQLGAVTIRFPGAGRDADSLFPEIVDAAARPAELIVVSSDKPVYSYARTRGAQALRAHEWTALGRDAKPRARGPAARSEKPERETVVEGWLKRFTRE